MKYRIKETAEQKALVEFAKTKWGQTHPQVNEMFEFGFATEEQLNEVIEIFNKKGLCGDDLDAVWNILNQEKYY